MNDSTMHTESHDGVSAAHLVEVVTTARDRVTDFAKEYPVVVPAAAAAIGFGAGVLVSSKLTRLALLVGSGVALSAFVRNDGFSRLEGLAEKLLRAS